MRHTELTNLLPPVRALARRAGHAILHVARQSREAELKIDGTPVTQADRDAHKIIATGLPELSGNLPILSEEGDVQALAGKELQRYWLVDPLDGTKEFVNGRDEYTVNIALVEQGRPVLGVIFVPAAETMYYAAEGAGAFRQFIAGHKDRLTARKCRKAAVAVVSRSHLSPQTQTYLQAHSVRKMIQRGSSLKMCAVAEGSADVYPRHGPTWLWDTAAGAVICREAGCCVVDWTGADLTYDPATAMKHTGFMVCSMSLRHRLLS